MGKARVKTRAKQRVKERAKQRVEERAKQCVGEQAKSKEVKAGSLISPEEPNHLNGQNLLRKGRRNLGMGEITHYGRASVRCGTGKMEYLEWR